MRRRPGEPDWDAVERALEGSGIDLPQLLDLMLPARDGVELRDGWPAVGYLKRALVRIAQRALARRIRDEKVVCWDAAMMQAAHLLGVNADTHHREAKKDFAAARKRVQGDKSIQDSPQKSPLKLNPRVA